MSGIALDSLILSIKITMKLTKKTQLTAVLAAFLFTATHGHANFGFVDVAPLNEVGSGANKSGLVIDFNDGASTERHIFQYNWSGASGSVSGAEMLTDVAAGTGLSFLNGGTVADGFFVSEMSLGSQSETNGDFVTNFDSWGFFIAGGTADGNAVAGAGETIPSILDSSPVGAGEMSFGSTGRFIADNSWDVWSFGAFSETYVVPEPASYSVLFGTLAIIFVSMRRRK